QRDDDAWSDERDLPVEIRAASLHLERIGRTVAGGPALEHVGDIDVLATPHCERGKHAVEKPPGLSHERLASGVFVGAGCLADKEPLRVRVADAGDRLVAAAAQGASRARVDICREICPIETGDALKPLGWKNAAALMVGRRIP